MPDTTFEEAKRCPRCEMPGESVSKSPGPRGSTIHMLTCRTEGCKWEDTSWVIQVNRDGSIPTRKKEEKDFEPLQEYQRQRSRDLVRAHEEIMQKGEIPR